MNCYRFLTVLLLSTCFLKAQSAEDLRSDTVDIIHYHINLDITDFAGASIKGFSTLTCTPKMSSVSNLNLDLLKLNIDSIVLGSTNLNYSYNDTLLAIQLANTYNVGDTFDISVYYHGNPRKDLSNWGGFYFQSGHAFNLGVGFDADPHNYGRVWFPCFDNFVERSTFSFDIISANNRKAYCNGELVNETILSGDTILRSWEMKENIPTYLACVAVGPYVDVKWTYQGIQSNIPVQIAVKASDSNKLKGSFIHLDDAMDTYEQNYGPYLFNKVGYSIVPFSSGAMEHASNVAYPSNAVNGNTGSELLMAHELSHHWWGDLVTCSTAEDMWLNEGWASYSEHLFLEHVYGHSRFIDEVKANHLNVIQYAHIREENYRAVSGVPHEYTYGMHVYDKGASVAHNLRAYMGDSLFYGGIKKFMDDNKFSSVSSAQLRDELSTYSGINLNPFFDDWVFGPGFAHVSIDSFNVEPTSGLYQVEIFTRQKKRGSDHFFTNMPVRVFFHDSNFNVVEGDIMITGEFDSFVIQSPIEPVMVTLNADNALCMAVTSDEKYISQTGTYEFENAKIKVEVENVSDSFLLRLEHHWASPDEIKNTQVPTRISNYRFWKVDGVFPSGLDAKATLEFDGRLQVSGGGGHLDNDLLQNGPDSIILLYRKDASHDWWEYQYYTKVSFGTVPFGRVELDTLLPGEYTFANGVSAIGIEEVQSSKSKFVLSPNPTKDLLKITESSGDSSMKEVIIFSTQGRVVAKEIMRSNVELDVSGLSNGNYLVYILKDNKSLFSGKFVVAK